MNLPIPSAVKNWLNYDSITGSLTWRRSPSSQIELGSEAGCFNKTIGYRVICFSNRNFYAHRIAWYLHYDQDPGELEIDHKNGNRVDNRIENLRSATDQEQRFNSKLNSNNTSGVKGVYWDNKTCKWRAEIKYNRKKIHVGRFDTLEQAQVAIQTKREQLHKEFTNHG